MQPPVLATKIAVPAGPPRAVTRPRLLQRLARQLPYARLTLVAAPAGYGKTTLLAQWARQGDTPPVAWLSLDESDNQIDRFFCYLLASWERAQPGVADSPLGLLLSALGPAREAVLSAFINLAQARDTRTAFVLDDYHLITDPAIHEAMAFLIDHLPSTLTIILTCRGEPPLPLARYRARQQLLELQAADLHFSAAETATFLSESQGLQLPPAAIERLHRQSEGWIAGLQLAALGLRQRPETAPGRQLHEASGADDGAGDVVLRGSHRFIADYLAQDVLAQQLPNVRDFLLRTAILPRFNAPLCAALLGDDGPGQRHAAQALLERLVRGNLFVVALDDERRWFRYHRLFSEFLQDEAQKHLSPDTLARLHCRAAEWHMDQGLPQEAFDHAITAADLPLVVRIFERYFFDKLHAGEFSLLTRWLDALPASWFQEYPPFLLGRAGVCLFTGAREVAYRCLDAFERQLDPPQSDDERYQLARATAVRCFIACFQNDLSRAEGYADGALQGLHENDVTFRTDTFLALGDAYRAHGRWREAERAYREVLKLAAGSPDDALTVHAYGALADLELRQGRLHKAAAYWHTALAALDEPHNWGRIPLSVSGWLHVRLAEIRYEWNELTEAQDLLERGLQRAELGGDLRAQLAGALLAARLALTRGELDAAQRRLEQALPLLEAAPPGEARGRYERLQLELWLAHNQLRPALAWADAAAERPDVEAFRRQLTLARLQTSVGDSASLQQTSRHLLRLRDAVTVDGRSGLLIETLALHALAQWRLGHLAPALTSLQQALELAATEGYIRLFADLGLPMARLLQEAEARLATPELLRPVLAAFDVGVLSGGAALERLPEPLTAREQEVLTLLAAGLTNREIGEQLSISPQTVKKHAGNIYGKLGVGNRTEAVARARSLKLLG